jgi:long-chain acyl-CoA synthetase
VQENFVCHLEANARRWAAKTAIVWRDGVLSWSELDRLASGFSAELSAQALGAGDRIAIVLPNSADFVIAFLAVLKLGATAVPLNPQLKQEELAAFINDLRPKYIIDHVRARPGIWTTVEQTESPSLILYTSGSTGRPKGSVFSHSALTFANQSWGGPVMRLNPDDRVLVTLPLAHSLGLNGGLLAPLFYGATVVLVERFNPEAVFTAMRDHAVTVFPGVATIFRRLLNSPAFSGADFSGLRVALSGAAPCPWELAEEWREKTSTRIIRGYGMTELFRPLSYRPDDPTDIPDAVGRPVPGVEIRIDDSNELLIKSPAMMDGYFGDPEETRSVLSDGWFSTGDLADVLEGGYVRILGRKRERILRGGYSIFPQEIEALLVSHPAVAEAAVVGIPSADLGEEIAAFVSLKPHARCAAEELLDFCKEHLAHYKYPRTVNILPELPKGPTGKVLKSELRASATAKD